MRINSNTIHRIFQLFYLNLYYQKNIDFSSIFIHNNDKELNAILERSLFVNFLSVFCLFSAGFHIFFFDVPVIYALKKAQQRCEVFNVFLIEAL